MRLVKHGDFSSEQTTSLLHILDKFRNILSNIDNVIKIEDVTVSETMKIALTRCEVLKINYLLFFELCKSHHGFVLSFYLQGGSLRELLIRVKQHGETLNCIEVLDWLVQMLMALKSLHELSATI